MNDKIFYEKCANCEKPYMQHYGDQLFCDREGSNIYKDSRWFPEHIANALEKAKEPKAKRSELPPIPEYRPYWDGDRAEFELTYRRDQLREALAKVARLEEREQEFKELIAYYLSEDRVKEISGKLVQQMQEMRGKLKDIRAYVRDGLYHASLDAIEEVLAAIPKEESSEEEGS